MRKRRGGREVGEGWPYMEKGGAHNSINMSYKTLYALYSEIIKHHMFYK